MRRTLSKISQGAKVLWSHVVQTLVDQNCCLEHDPPPC